VRDRLWLSIGIVAAGVGILLAVDVARPAPGAAGGTLRLSSSRDVDSVDPALAYSSIAWMMEFATCAKLYSYPDRSRGGTTVIPEIATSLPRFSADGKTATIELAHTYRFHTGARITAANFVAAFKRDADPRMQSPASLYLGEIAGVKALGPYTLQIRTTRPLGDLAGRLTMPLFCPVAPGTPRHAIDNPLGSGPYYVASRVRNRLILLERNRFYRGPRHPHVDHVVWEMGAGQEACRASVERNETDYCVDGVPSEAFGAIARKYGVNRKGGRFYVNPRLATFYFAFNHDRPAFRGAGQIPLKQAINYVLDRAALVRAAGFRAGEPTDQILPLPMTRDERIYPLHGVSPKSVAAAKALVAKAGNKPKKLVVYTANSEPFATWGQIFQLNVKQLGIDVEVKYFAIDVLDHKLSIRGEPYDVAFNRWIVDYADPIGYFEPLLDGEKLKATGNTNFAYFDRPVYNSEIARIDRLGGPERSRAFANLDVTMMRDDPPWAPIMVQAWRDFVSSSFGCYVYQPVIARVDIVAACKK
jgi:peptide/nickel transport system substrate-binding protein